MKRVTLEDIGKKHLMFQVSRTVEIEGQEIEAVIKLEYELDFEAGVAKGGTCLVYHAYKIVKSSKGFLKHKVILKESKISPDEYAWEKQAITDNVKFHIIFLGNTWVYLLIS